MIKPMRVAALAAALALTPACASLQLGQPRLENPVSAANTLDQRAYAALHAYAAVIEEAADIVRDPALRKRAEKGELAFGTARIPFFGAADEGLDGPGDGDVIWWGDAGGVVCLGAGGYGRNP